MLRMRNIRWCFSYRAIQRDRPRLIAIGGSTRVLSRHRAIRDCTVLLAIYSTRFPHSTDVIPRRISFHEDSHADETRLFLYFSSSARDDINDELRGKRKDGEIATNVTSRERFSLLFIGIHLPDAMS